MGSPDSNKNKYHGCILVFDSFFYLSASIHNPFSFEQLKFIYYAIFSA